jgi:hypothetical protein
MDLIKRSAKRIHWIAGASLLLAACATVQPLEYPPDHPANPGAPVGAEMPSSSTLATYKSFAGRAGPGTDASPNADQGTAPQAEQPSKEGAHEHHH